MAERLTILFSGMIAGVPRQGGATWAVLQYLLGLRRLGHAVYFVEPIADAALRPAGAALAESENAAYFREVAEAFSLTGCAALLRPGTRDTVGLPYGDLLDAARRADVLINISGMLTEAALLEPIPRRVYLDLDPAFVQLWQAAQGIDMRFDRHTHFVTVGQAIGTDGCAVPTCGRSWIPTWQPVVLEDWPATPGERITYQGLTTIANWRGYGSIEHGGLLYGQKAHALRPLISLPMRTDEPFLLAMVIHPDEARDLDALRANRWQLVDPIEAAATPERYRRFIQASKAEFGLAKQGYSVSRCGWFSDRSACYLASGRPVIAQETGFSRLIPTGEGLFAFETAEDVLAGIDAMRRDYPAQCRAARRLAERYFDSDQVLTRLLERVGAG